MRAAAQALGLSPRTLRRRLHEEGASYHAVVEGALALLAKQLLADERRSIQETADAVGFSDPGAFSRAFKRWTGSTPKRFQIEQAQSRSPT
jgi:AraC-like DNA-binding protein